MGSYLIWLVYNLLMFLEIDNFYIHARLVPSLDNVFICRKEPINRRKNAEPEGMGF